MKTAYFDCTFGISGDMILGALTACGMPFEHLERELAKLGVHGYELKEEKKMCSGIGAVKIDVITGHEHAHRHLSHIREIIESSSLSDRVKERAIAVFTKLAEAEAKVHDTTPEKIHFHEVGAVDAIVDVVGACIGLEYHGIEQVVSAPLRHGTGTVQCAHGVMPVPVPAVVELSAGVPVVRTSYDGEITTPTGAAIMTALAASFGPLEDFTVETSGYGAGTKEWEDHPNILRVIIGETAEDSSTDRCVMLESNIDDMNPELYGNLMDTLFAAGAKDVFMTSVYMKKNRPATLLSVLAGKNTADTLAEIVLTETTTLGVRMSDVVRKKLVREESVVDTEFGEVKVKTARVGGAVRISPEYDDCVRIAKETGLPLLTVFDRVKAAAISNQ